MGFRAKVSIGRAVLFPDLADGPDVEDTEIVEEGKRGHHADCGDHVFVVRTKSAIAVHATLQGREVRYWWRKMHWSAIRGRKLSASAGLAMLSKMIGR